MGGRGAQDSMYGVIAGPPLPCHHGTDLRGPGPPEVRHQMTSTCPSRLFWGQSDVSCGLAQRRSHIVHLSLSPLFYSHSRQGLSFTIPLPGTLSCARCVTSQLYADARTYTYLTYNGWIWILLEEDRGGGGGFPEAGGPGASGGGGGVGCL